MKFFHYEKKKYKKINKNQHQKWFSKKKKMKKIIKLILQKN